MKIVFKIFGILSMLGIIGSSLLIGLRMSNELEGLAEAGEMSEMVAAIAESMGFSEGSLQTAMIFAFITMIIGIVGFVAMFVTKKTFRLGAAGAVALFTILTYILTPSIDAGAYGPADPKGVALSVMISGLIGAACIFGLTTVKKA